MNKIIWTQTGTYILLLNKNVKVAIPLLFSFYFILNKELPVSMIFLETSVVLTILHYFYGYHCSACYINLFPWFHCCTFYIKLTRSAILCGSVAWPRLARTLGRIAGGCGAIATVVGIGWPWKTCRNTRISSTKTEITGNISSTKTKITGNIAISPALLHPPIPTS